MPYEWHVRVGIRWMRTLIRGLADEGRTVLVSSHVLSEVEQIADEILVIARGALKFAGTMEDLADPRTGPVVVDAADRSALSGALEDAGYEYEVLRSGLTVRGSDAATIGRVTAHAGVALTTLQQRGPTLEDVFLDLVNDRYVPPPAPVPDETALFDLPGDADEDSEGDDERLRLASLAQPVSSTATPSPALNDPEEAPEQDLDPTEAASPLNSDSTADLPPRDVERAEGETKRVERPEGVETTPEADERPLPGLSDLAAVASLFATSAVEPNSAAAGIEAADAEERAESAENEDAESEDAESEDPEDLDATRIIDVVPSADGESDPESDADHANPDDENADPERDEHSDQEHSNHEQR